MNGGRNSVPFARSRLAFLLGAAEALLIARGSVSNVKSGVADDADYCFPSPMPAPARGLEQHYDVNADEYFQHHDLDGKGQIACGLLAEGARLTGGKGRVLVRGRKWTVNLAPTFSPFHVFGFNPLALRTLLKKHNLSIANWRVYPGRSVLAHTSGIVSTAERFAAHTVTAVRCIGTMGTYIEAWAVKD